MEVYISKLGPRYFLTLEGCASIPLDSIKEFRYDPPNGGCSNSIAIIIDEEVSHLSDPNYIFAYENADAIKDFLKEKMMRQLPDQVTLRVELDDARDEH